MTVEASIARALLGRLEQIDVFSPKPIIIHPLRRVKAPVGELYLMGQLLYNEPVTRAVRGQGGQYRGFLQVTVIGPATTDEGVIPMLEMAGLVVEYFQKDTVMDSDSVRVRIIRKPWASAPFLDGGQIRVPVSIPFVHNRSV